MYQIPYMKRPAFMTHDLSVFKNFAISSTNEDRKLQFRFSMYNFPNHPIGSMESTDLQLNFNQGKLTDDTLKNFGRASRKDGKRIMQFALKFMF